jgi:hypothetical protein
VDPVDIGFICDRERIEDPWELVDGVRASRDVLLASTRRGEVA